MPAGSKLTSRCPSRQLKIRDARVAAVGRPDLEVGARTNLEYLDCCCSVAQNAKLNSVRIEE
jgi:hypothetical protein